MHHDEAFASDDHTLADWLHEGARKKSVAADGSRLTWDSVGGVWRNDADLVRNARARRSVRSVLGNERDATAMNRAGL